MATTASETKVQELYIAYFGRPADPAGLAFYADALDAASTTVEAIATSFAASTEAATIVALDTDAYLSAVYLQAFGRAYVEGTDGTFWKDAINNAATTKELAMVQILEGASGTDTTAVANKVTVAKTYTAAVIADSKDYSGDTAAAAAKAVLDAVTEDAATVTSGNTAAQTAVDSLSTGVAGTTSALTTTATDIIAGTSGNDTITGDATTYQTGDLVVDTTTNDSDTLNVALTAANTAVATVSGIENINFNVTSFAAASVSADNIRGGAITVNQLQVGGSADATVNNVDGTNDTAVTAGTGITGTLTVDLASGGATVNGGSATTVSVTDANVGAAGDSTTITANSATTITVTNVDLDGTTITSGKAGTTAAQVAINVDGTGATTDAVTISANGVVDLDIAATDVVEIISLSGNGAAATFNLDASDAPEEITVTGDQSVTIAGTAAQLTGEKLTDTSTAGTTTVSVIAAGVLDIDTDFAADVLSLNVNMAGNQIDVASGQAITVAVTEGTGLDVNAAAAGSATNSVALTIDDGLDAVNTINLGTVDITNMKTVSILANDNLTSTAGSYGATTAVTLSGAGTASFTSTALSLDASGLTGVLTATASANLKTITAGSAADTITGYNGDMTIDGGDGNDTFSIDGAIDLSDDTVSLSNIEIIQLDVGDSGAETYTVDSSLVSGASYIVKGGTTADDTLSIKLDATSVDGSSLVIDTTSVNVTFDVSGIAAVASTITGTNGVDSITGEGTGAVTIDGGAGNDTLDVSAGSAAHNVSGGAGDDILTGGAGSETLNGGADDDTIDGAAGNDTIIAGAGDDTIDAGAGTNTVDLTGGGNDTITFDTDSDAVTTITGFTLSTTAADADTISIADASGDDGETVTSAAGTAVDPTTLTTQIVTLNASTTSMLTAGTETIADFTDMTDVAAYLEEGFNIATTEEFKFILNDGTSSYIYDVVEAGDTVIDAGEVTLIGVVSNAILTGNDVAQV